MPARTTANKPKSHGLTRKSTCMSKKKPNTDAISEEEREPMPAQSVPLPDENQTLVGDNDDNDGHLYIDNEYEKELMRQEEEEESEEAQEGDEDDDDSDDDDLPHAIFPIVPKKRKTAGTSHGAPAKKRAARAPTPEEDEEAEEIVALKITYNILVFSLAELAKKSQKAREPQARLLILSSDLDWPDVKAQLKIKAVDVLFPQEASVDDNAFTLLFVIPRYVPDALPLSSLVDYQYLVENALKGKSQSVKIIVRENDIGTAHTADKENAAPAPTPASTKKTAKSRAPNANDILPGNVAKNDNIKLLRTRWECNASNCRSGSAYCYVPAEGPHFPLSHNLFDKWAAAMLHTHGGEPSATLDHPPDIRDFDAVSTHTIVSRSPLLQSRVQAMQKERKGHHGEPAPAPVVNVVLPASAYGPAPAPAAPAPVVPVEAVSLIPVTHEEGPKMDVATFCSVYALPATVLGHFNENAVTGTHAFSHMAPTDLTAMGFKIGEVIDLKEAIKEWAVRKGV